MFKSATVRLTLWYLAIVMVISLMFSAVVYQLARDELQAGLSQQTQRIFNEFPVFSSDPSLVRRQNADIAVGERRILWHLAYFNGMVLVGAGFASYLLARRTLRPIEEAHVRQQRFTADVSHELRTPLTSLKMSSEVTLMDKAASKADLRAALESNIEDTAVMEKLVNNLLRLTRLDDQAAQLGYKPVAAREVISLAIAHTEPQAAGKQLTIEQHIEDLILYGEQDSLVQLLVIVLDNAIKYSPEGSEINISSQVQGRLGTITVIDKGIGIEPSAMPHIFDRFYREDKARGSRSGFGLGLSIAKLIADRHEGVITVSSQQDNGTTVTIALPLAAQPPAKALR